MKLGKLQTRSMASPRKPIPYAAGILIDKALMELSDLTRAAMKLANQDTTEENRMRLVTKIVDHAYKATINLHEITRQGDKENDKL